MTNIAFLGLGAMGSRMAKRLIDAGHRVTVWNRNPNATEPLVEAGAIAAETPRQAAVGADFVIAMVRDDDASRSVWCDAETGAIGGLSDSAVAIECSTLTPQWVRKLADKVAGAGAAFLDAPLAGSRPQAEAGKLIFMVGGTDEHLSSAHPILDSMGGAVHHAGDVGSGATVKLMVNALFGSQLAMMGELIGFAAKSDIDPERAMEIIGSTPVCSLAAKLSAGAMLAGQWMPAFPIDLVAKDFGLAKSSAETVGAQMPLTEATGETYQKAAGAGYAKDNITGIVQLYHEVVPKGETE
ncbi:MAG: NAD(P)-dependent oxidoreductase [Ahrensia sp.]|nr:NAD(P)-dependent oxidoreductase [Ahrensia sp.]